MAWAVFMFPLVRTPRLVAPRAVSPAVVVLRTRLCNHSPPSTPDRQVRSVRRVAADRSGACGSKPVNARVIMETRAGALSAATGRASPGPPPATTP